MLYSELEQKGWNKWVMSLEFNQIAEDAQGPILVGSGWQSWNSNKCATKENEDGTTSFSMAWVPFNDTLMEAVNAEGENKNFDKNVSDTAYFNIYYHGPHSSGKKIEYAGFVTLTKEAVFSDENPEEQVGWVVTDIVFNEALYDRYIDTIPSKVNSLLESASHSADNTVAQTLSEGNYPNSVNLVTMNLDGTENTEPVKYSYGEAEQEELLRAFMAISNGVQSYRLKMKGIKAVTLNAQEIATLYCEMEMFRKALENRNEVFKEYLATYKDGGKELEDTVAAIKFEDPMPEQYEAKVEELNAQSMAELQVILDKYTPEN